MRIRNRRLLIFGLVMLAGLSALTLAVGGTPDVIGRVVRSSNATVDGGALLSNGTILSGNAVKVGDDGVVLLSYSPTGRAVLGASTSVRFSSAKGNVVAQLLAGTMAVQRQNKDVFVVKTSTYKIEPQGEGRSEFVVALLPDKRATVETQHGKVVITEIRSGESYTVAEGLVAQIPAPQTEAPAKPEEQHKVIGKVVSSAGAIQNGKQLPSSGWVLDGDSVSTGAAGRAVIQLLPTNLVTLDENTSVGFSIPVDRVWLQLQNGDIVVENKGESNVLIATTKFHIEPNSTAPAKIAVRVSPDNSTYIESISGDINVKDIQSDQSYLLPAGQKTLVPADATGIPGLQPIQSGPAPTPAPGTTPSKPPVAPGVAKHSNNTIIIIGVAAGGGIAAAVGALAAGGHGSSSSPPPISPSVP